MASAMDSLEMPNANDTDHFAEVGCASGSLLDQEHVRYPIMIAYILVFGIVMLGNAFTIVVICIHRSMRTDTNFFLANLAFADMLVAFFCILQNMYQVVGHSHGHWPLGETLCKLYVLFLHLIPSTSIGILVCVSMEKYIAVLHPLLALKLLTNKLRVFMMIAIWALSIATNLPYYFTTSEWSLGDSASCIRNEYGVLEMKDMLAMSFIIWYCIPLASIAYLYTRIGMVLWNSGVKPPQIRYSNDSEGRPPTLVINYETQELTGPANELHRSNSNGTGSRVHDETHSSINSDVYESRKKIIRLLIAIVSSFAILTLPHHARLLYHTWTNSITCNGHPSALVQPLSYLCLFMSSGVNPILYAFMSQRFREAVRDIASCRTGMPRRKHTRTRTFVSDIPEISRSPSLLRRDNSLQASEHNNNSSNSNNNTLTVNGYGHRALVSSTSTA